MIEKNLSTLKIHKLTQEQYDRELAAGRLDENALYLTPDEKFASGNYATIEQLNAKADIPKMTTVNMPANSWVNDENLWYQVITINSITANSKIDLQPSARQLLTLQNEETALMAENDDGVVTVYALGNKPTQDYSIQVLITEVAMV